MQKNEATTWFVFAFGGAGHANEGEPIAGDAAQITADLRLDSGAANAIDDTNPTDVLLGLYRFDITAAETDANGQAFGEIVDGDRKHKKPDLLHSK